MLKAVTRQSGKVDAKIKALNAEAEAEGRKQTISTANFFDHYATPQDLAVMVTEEDFMDAHRELIPSVSAGELSHYERVRATFEGGRESNGGANPSSEKQRPVPLNLNQRTVSTASQRSAKGKGKSVATGKGKGKAVAHASDGEDAEYEDDYGVLEAPGDGGDGPNGISSKSKGKGKAVAGFQDGTASDDEGLYD